MKKSIRIAIGAAIGAIVAGLVGKRMVDRANEIEESTTNGPDELRAMLEEFFEPEFFDPKS